MCKRPGLWPHAGLLAVLAACGPSPVALDLADAEVLRAERAEWRGPAEGLLWLRRSVHVQVGTATDPSHATSHMTFHAALTFLGRSAKARGDEGPALRLPTPAGARLEEVRARLLAPASEAAVQLAEAVEGPSARPLDPGQREWTLRFGPVPPGAILEVVARFAVPGTLATDVRALGAPEGRTAELLLRYDVPSGAAAHLQVLAGEGQPLVTEQAGLRILALRVRDVPPTSMSATAPPHARFVLEMVSPRGFTQRFATSWARATQPYSAELVAASERYRRGYPAPVKPTGGGAEAARELYRWTRDRLQRPDAMASSWDAGRERPPAITANDLTATDKVHLLHWLLEEAGVEHAVAIARGKPLPRLDPERPTPGAFDTPLIHVSVPAGELWLDPACQTCAPGEVREALRGQQAILLPARGERPRDLPGGP